MGYSYEYGRVVDWFKIERTTNERWNDSTMERRSVRTNNKWTEVFKDRLIDRQTDSSIVRSMRMAYVERERGGEVLQGCCGAEYLDTG